MTIEVKQYAELVVSSLISNTPFEASIPFNIKKNQPIRIPWAGDGNPSTFAYENFKLYLEFLNRVEKEWTKILKKNKEF